MRGSSPRMTTERVYKPRLSDQRWGKRAIAGLLHRRVVHLGDVLPIDQMIHERLQVVRPAVAVIDVVGVLPDVAAEDRLAAVHQRVLAIGSLGDGDLAVLDREPAPARSELGHAGLNEVFLHLGDRAEVRDDLLLEIAGNLVAAAVRLHPLPEVEVVVVLAGIVEHGRVLAVGALDDLLERFALEFRALDRVVAVVDVGEVVLVVVVLQRLLRHVGLEGVMRIGKIGQGKGGEVMLVVVVFQRLPRHVGREGVMGIGQVGQRE